MQTCVEVHDFGRKRRNPAVIGCLSHLVSSVNRSEFPEKIWKYADHRKQIPFFIDVYTIEIVENDQKQIMFSDRDQRTLYFSAKC